MYDHAVLIGRFQPFHNGHLALVRDALTKAHNLVILVGSANIGRTTRNPFTFEERSEMIYGVLNELEFTHRVEVVPLDDHPYDLQRWIEGVQRAMHVTGGSTVALSGHEKDHSSFYLKKFPQWPFIGTDSKKALTPFAATPMRAQYYMGEIPKYGLPSKIIHYLCDFAKTSTFELLKQEFIDEQAYRAQWGSGPFQCADSVVIQSGHILVVERGGVIGRGRLALPGGHLELNETLDACAVRELFEETKIFGACISREEASQILWRGYRGRERFDDPHRSTRARVITEAFLFKLEDAATFPEIQGADDAKRAFWIPLGQVEPRIFFDDHAFIIQRMLRYL